MVNTTYLPYVIITVIVEAITLLLVLWKANNYYSSRLSERQNCVSPEVLAPFAERHDPLLLNDSDSNSTPLHSFQSTFRTAIPNSNLRLLLLFTRLLSFGYLCGVGVFWGLLRSGGWQYFTTWNLELLSVYYLLSAFLSVVGLVYDDDDVEWSKSIRIIGRIAHVLFQVAGATAILVTVVAFSLLNPEFTFWNSSDHFATLCSILWELCLNGMFVQFEDFRFNVAWAALYLIFIWPVVATGIRSWPYDFLQVNSPACFGWYSGLLLVNFLFYCVWFGLSRLKLRFMSYFKVKSTVTGALLEEPGYLRSGISNPLEVN